MKFTRFLKRKIRSALHRFGMIPDRRLFIFDHVPTGGVVAEVGVWKGEFSELILKYNRPQKLYLIDPWQLQPEFSDRMFGGSVATDQSDMDDIFTSVQQHLASYESVEYLRMFSKEAAASIPDASLDWVYIDGNHYYDYVLEDLTLYGQKVKVGGYIVGDDYGWRPHPEGEQEVKLAVEAFLNTTDMYEIVTKQHGQFILRKRG